MSTLLWTNLRWHAYLPAVGNFASGDHGSTYLPLRGMPDFLNQGLMSGHDLGSLRASSSV
jgi:hypothetical protein